MGGEIGSGSFGQVYKAMDIDTGKIIAVKKIPVVDTLGSAGADINVEIFIFYVLRKFIETLG